MNAETLPTVQNEKPSFRFSKRQAIALVCGCTLFGAAAQILFKFGANQLTNLTLEALAANPMMILQIIIEPPLFAGYFLYGLSTILLTLALRDGELSVLYPVISMTYVWVTLLSVVIFHETLNPFKVLGLASIVFGVAMLGRDGKR